MTLSIRHETIYVGTYVDGLINITWEKDKFVILLIAQDSWKMVLNDCQVSDGTIYVGTHSNGLKKLVIMMSLC